MEWGKWVLGYFNWSRRERIGVLVLAFLILFSFFLPRIVAGPGFVAVSPDTAWIAKLRELELKQQKEEKVRSRAPEDQHLLAFQYDRPTYNRPERPKYTDTLRRYPAPFKKTAPAIIADINSADTTDFIALPGIGSKLANRIVNFREKLGGFYSIDQIAEVYGLQDSVFQKIRPSLQINIDPVKKININTATIDELKTHPYIKYAIAKAIIAYRNEHGAFSIIEDVKKIMLIDEALYMRIAPYLSIDFIDNSSE